MNLQATYRENIFSSVEEMDATVQAHIQYKKITGNIKKVLICLKEYSKLNFGVCKLKAETIAEKTSTSRSTVMRALKRLIELKIIEKVNCTKMNGIKGASIYLILPFADTSRMKHRDTTEKPHESNVCGERNESEYIKSFNLLKSFKTSTLQEIYNIAHEDENYMNEWQKMLLELLAPLGIDETLQGELNKLILATEINDVAAFHMAKEVIVNLAKDLQSGRLSIQTTLRAIYKGAYNKRLERTNKTVVANKQTTESRTVPFYNWLDERESADYEAERQKFLAKLGAC